MGNQNVLISLRGVNTGKESKIFANYMTYLENPNEPAENLLRQAREKMICFH